MDTNTNTNTNDIFEKMEKIIPSDLWAMARWAMGDGAVSNSENYC